MILPRQYDPGVIDPARPVNRDCPLTRGINLWWHFGVPPFPTGPNTYHVPDLTRRPKSRGFLFGTVARVRTAKPGLDGAVTLSGTNNVSTTTFGEADDAFPNTTAATVLLVHRKTDTTLRASMAFGNNEGATTNRIGCHLPWSDGNVYWDWGGSTNNSTRLTVSGLTHTTDWRWWAFTVGGGLGMRAYRDGVLVGSNAATPTRTLTGSTAFFMGRAFNTGDLAEFAECVCFDRALTPGEVWEWAEQSRAGHPDTLTRWNPKQYLFFGDRDVPAVFDPADGSAFVSAVEPYRPRPAAVAY